MLSKHSTTVIAIVAVYLLTLAPSGCGGDSSGGAGGEGGAGGSSAGGGVGGAADSGSDQTSSDAGSPDVQLTECDFSMPCPPGTFCSLDGKCVVCEVDDQCKYNPNGSSCQQGLCVCALDYENCNGGNDGCEANLKLDTDNCGGCGVSCNGGACQHGVCGPPPEVVLTTIGAREFAIDDSRVFFVGPSPTPSTLGVWSAALNGTDQQKLDESKYDVMALMAAADHVYYVRPFTKLYDGGEIRSVPKAGGTSVVLESVADDLATQLRLQVEGGDLYYNTRDIPNLTNLVFRRPVPVGNPVEVASSTGGFFIDQADIFTMQLLDGPPFGVYSIVVQAGPSGTQKSLGTTSLPCWLDYAVDATHVYFNGPNAHEISRVPRAGGPPTVLFSTSSTEFGNCARRVKLSSTHVYFAMNEKDGNGLAYAVIKVPKTGGAYTALSRDQLSVGIANGVPTCIAAA